MKKNVMLGYTPQAIYDRLWKEFTKIYIGKGLYIDINSITIIEPKIKTKGEEETESLNICEIKGTCGRYEEEGINNFNQDFEIRFEEGDTLDYIAGKFAMILDE